MPRKRRAALKTITVPDEFKNSEELEMNMEKHTGKLIFLSNIAKTYRKIDIPAQKLQNIFGN